ncbi:stretch-activated Ca2+-permeable channel component-domain-containing protein [Syncephalis plumigaleata]|nr:stretch-activated Ca2+-permeable channel component-domain-containing protein [Syncephalis plumigaleata]
MAASCVPASGLTFCDKVSYSIPVPTSGNVSNAAQAYDERARNYYKNFTKLVDQFDCDQEYSFERNCNSCRAAYRDWLCATTIPRCSANGHSGGQEPNLKDRDANHPRALNETGSWTEVLPCVGLCYMVIQSCPSYFQFVCPSEEQTRVNSYGTVLHYDNIVPKSKFTKDSAQCNALGIARVLSETTSSLATSWSEIPYEMQVRIVTLLDIQTVVAFAKVCKAFHKIVCDDWTWKGLLVNRYGPDALPKSITNTSYLEWYKQCSVPELHVIDSFSIAHMGSRYWSTIDLEENGMKVAWLNYVCWLHLHGTLKRVPRGTYQVIWLLYTSNELFSMRDLTFSAQVLDQTVNGRIEVKPGIDRLRGTETRQLNEYTMPGLLRVEPDYDYADVQFEAKDITSPWKGGIGFVAVRLVPINEADIPANEARTLEGQDAGDHSTDSEDNNDPNGSFSYNPIDMWYIDE